MNTFLLLALFFLTGCLQKGTQAPAGGKGVPQDITISLLSITPPIAVASLNQTLKFQGVGGTPPYVFSVQSGYGAISEDGEFTASSIQGSTTVKVKDAQNNSAFSVVSTTSSLLISPANANVGTGNTFQFASGGGVAPYTYSLVSGAGSIHPSTGLYTAPAVAGTAVVRVTDAQNTISQANLSVTTALTLSPATATVEDLSVTNFTAAGGVAPYTFSVYAGGGAINPATGAYTAPATPGTVIIRVQDVNGLVDESAVSIQTGPDVSVSSDEVSTGENLQLSVTNGSAPYTYTILTGTGSVSPTGLFSSGSITGTSVVRVTDQNGFTFDKTITIFVPTKVAIGDYYVCYVRQHLNGISSDAKCVGRNYYGSLGDSTYTLGDGPNEMGNALPVVQLGPNLTPLKVYGAHNGRVCVLFSNYKLKCFGENGNGQNGASTNQSTGYYPITMGAALPFATLGTNVLVESSVPVSRSVAMGGTHTCAIVTGGKLKCWGWGGYGQLGLGNTYTYCNDPSNCGNNLPYVNLGAETALQVSAGENHTCVLLTPSMRVKCWGQNNYGQLGQGHTSNLGLDGASTPDQIAFIDLGMISGSPAKVKQITTGWNHSCAILENDKIKCWGSNDYGNSGAYGVGHFGDQGAEMGDTLPYVNVSSTKTPREIVSQVYHTCTIFTDNTMKCWGYNAWGQLGLGTTNNFGDQANEMGDYLPLIDLGTNEQASEVAVGFRYTCVRTVSGKVKCFGHGYEGNLGLGDQVDRGDQPGEMGDALPFVSLSSTATALNVSISGFSTCVTLSNNTVKCWGYDAGSGALGQEVGGRGTSVSQKMQNFPNINFGPGIYAKDVKASYLSTCFIMMDDTLRCFGYNEYGDLALGTTGLRGRFAEHFGDNAKPNLGPGLSFTQYAIGAHVSCGMTSDLRLKCWGYGGDGRNASGDGANMGNDAWETGNGIPFVYIGTDVIRSINSKGGFACGLFNNSLPKCWGENNFGQLGYGDTTPRGNTAGTTPGNLPFIDLGTGRTVKQMDSGLYHSCAILDNDKVKCWGRNDYGQLGQEHTNSKGDNASEMGDNLTYVSLGSGLVPKKLALGHYHSCVIFTNNKVKCWGYEGAAGTSDAVRRGNSGGNMGDNLPFVNFSTQHTAIDLFAGGTNTCVVLENNSVKCWGENNYGQLGVGHNYSGVGMDPFSMGENLPSW